MTGLKFTDIPVNTTFFIRGVACMKVDRLYYVRLDGTSLGQEQATDAIDGHIHRTQKEANEYKQNDLVNKVKASQRVAMDANEEILLRAMNSELTAQVTKLTAENKKLKKAAKGMAEPAAAKKVAAKKVAPKKNAPKKVAKKAAKKTTKKK